MAFGVTLNTGTMVVVEVSEDSDADQLGVEINDEIIQVNHMPCTSVGRLREIGMRGTRIRSVTVIRNNEQIVLGETGAVSSTPYNSGEEAFRRAMLAELGQMNDRLRYMHYIMVSFGIVFIVIPALYILFS